MAKTEGGFLPRSTGFKVRWRATDSFIRTLYIFNALSLVGGTVYGLYYGIFLYKNTFSLSVLALDGLLGGFGTWLGYMMGAIAIKKLGYGCCLKIAFGLWAVVSFGTAAAAHHIAEWFMVIAIFKTLPAGICAAACDAIMLREIRNDSRGSFLQIKLGLEFLVAVILPATVGALIRYTQGYELAFVVAGFVYCLAFLIPVKLPRPELHFTLKELGGVFKRPLYTLHATNRTLGAGFNQINAFALMIVPFLMLKDEMKMGLLTSGVALVACVVSFAAPKIKAHRKLKVGYTAYGVRGLFSLLFVCFWSAPVLAIWQLIGKLATPLHDPLQQNLDIHNDKLIMGDDVREKALHINVLNNTLLLLGATAAYGTFFFITKAAAGHQQLVLQLLIMSFAAWRFANLALSSKINAKARQLTPDLVELRKALPLTTLIWRSLGGQVMKFRFMLARYRHELLPAR